MIHVLFLCITCWQKNNFEKSYIYDIWCDYNAKADSDNSKLTIGDDHCQFWH